jgi:hypothetical protein
LNEVQRGRAVRSVFNVEAFGFERAADDVTESRFVVYHQHGGPVPDRAVRSGEGGDHVAPAGSRVPCRSSGE